MLKKILLLCFLIKTSALLPQTITLHVSGIRNNKGNIRFQFFDSKENFDNKKPAITKVVSKKDLVQGTLTVDYWPLPAGTYGVAILDDENNNQEMDYSFFMPTEGFGFSDYYHAGMSRPDYNKFKFNMGTGVKSTRIKVRYL